MEGVDQHAPVEFLVEHTGEEAIPRPLGVDHLGADLLELPVAGERECDLVLPAAEVLRIIPLPEEHADIGSFVLQGANEVHQVGLDTAAVAVLPVICNKRNFHRDLILIPARTHPRSPSLYPPT